MKKFMAVAIIAIIGIFAAACANTATNGNTTLNRNAANANVNSATSNSMHGDDHRMNMMNGNHQEMGNRQMQKGMNMKPNEK